MPVNRSAPVKVVVFQWPCGTLARQRLAMRRSSTQAGHLCGEAGLVDEHELRRIEIELAVEPVPAPLQDVGAILLQCVRGLFLNVQPWPRSQALKALRLIRTECSALSRSTISFSVMSLRSSISPTMKASCASRLEAAAALRAWRQFTDLRPRNPADRAGHSHAEPRRRLPRRHALVRSLQDPRPKIPLNALPIVTSIEVDVESEQNAAVTSQSIHRSQDAL
jgi:hypothetical protein